MAAPIFSFNAFGVERHDCKTDLTDGTDLNGLFRLRRYDFDKKEKGVAEGKSQNPFKSVPSVSSVLQLSRF
jgi:hypothetical protein